MTEVLLARAADSGDYTHLILADPVGSPQAGADVITTFIGPTEDGDGEVTHTLTLHGQRELDVPSAAVEVKFPDGTAWKPKK